jgi:hypothetical protein
MWPLSWKETLLTLATALGGITLLNRSGLGSWIRGN